MIGLFFSINMFNNMTKKINSNSSSLNITNVGQGVEASLVAVTDSNYDCVEISLQKNKSLTVKPKICLITDKLNFNKFLKKLKNELKNHSLPELYTVATLHCTSMCEILKIIKVDNDTFDVLMYYNYKRPRTKKCVDYVPLTANDLNKFVAGINI